MLLHRLGRQQKVVQINKSVWYILQDRLKEALPGAWTRGQPERKAIVPEHPAPGVQGRRLVAMARPDGHVEKGTFEVDNTEDLTSMDLVSKIF